MQLLHGRMRQPLFHAITCKGKNKSQSQAAFLQRGRVGARWGARIGVTARRRGRPRWRHPVDARLPGRSHEETTQQRTLSRRSACRPPLPEPAARRSSAPHTHRHSAPQIDRAPACPSSMSTGSPAILQPAHAQSLFNTALLSPWSSTGDIVQCAYS